jgi:hypothetical protein
VENKALIIAERLRGEAATKSITREELARRNRERMPITAAIVAAVREYDPGVRVEYVNENGCEWRKK